MSDHNKPADSVFVHEPLPYVVRLRSTLTDDAVPEVRDFHVLAYGVFEAAMQAVMEAGGLGLEDARHRVESVSADLPAYIRLVAARLTAQKASASA